MAVETGAAGKPGGPVTAPLLLDRLLPDFDAIRIEHRVVPGRVDAAYDAVKRADFIEGWRGNVTVRMLFATRMFAERGLATARRRPPPDRPETSSYRLADMPRRGTWILLGEDPPREIAFGVVGRFWSGETSWEELDAADFAAFDQPGMAKIAAHFSVLPYGDRRSLVSYACRTQATDATARRAFMRYWRPLSPFIGVVMRSMLDVIAAQAGREAHS
jgi:hypothetical protein